MASKSQPSPSAAQGASRRARTASTPSRAKADPRPVVPIESVQVARAHARIQEQAHGEREAVAQQRVSQQVERLQRGPVAAHAQREQQLAAQRPQQRQRRR